MPNSDSNHMASTPIVMPGGPSSVPALPAPPGAGATYQTVPASQELTAGTILQAFRRRWLTALLLATLGGVLAGAATWYLVPSKYTASAILHVASHAPQGLLSSWLGVDDFANYQRTQAALVKSRLVINAALRKPEVAELAEVRDRVDPVGWLEKGLKVDTNLGPELLRVTLNGDNAEETALLVNAVTMAYIHEVVNKDRSRQQDRFDQLQENYRKYEDTLRRKRRMLKQLEESLGVEDPKTTEMRYGAELQKLTAIQTELRQTRGELARATQEAAALQVRQNDPPEIHLTDIDLEDFLAKDPTYQKYLAKQAQVEEDIELINNTATGRARSESLAAKRGQVESLLAAMKNRRGEVRVQVEGQLKAKAQAEVRANLEKLRDRAAGLREAEKTGLLEVSKQEAEVKRLALALKSPDKATAELETLRSEVGQTEALLKRINDQLDLLKVEPPAPSRVSLVEAAEVPQTKNEDRQMKFAGMAAFGTFGLVLLGVTLLECRTRRVYGADDVVQNLGLALVGTLPTLPAQARLALPTAKTARDVYWQNLLTESVDAIRTQLLHAAQTESLGVVMVTSALGGEGKTSLASHLATSLARAWRKTLLVDCDLRNPGAHKQFGQELEPGFSEVLRGESEADDVVRPTPVSRLWMISAGRWDSHAIQALAQEAVRGIFDRLREQYDFIVIDSSPVLPVADALALGQNVDAVILAVLRDVSRLPTVAAAHHRLATLGIRVFGTVVIGAGGDVPGLTYQYPKQTAP